MSLPRSSLNISLHPARCIFSAEPMTQQMQTGWRGSPEGWLQAAYDALIDGGVDAVRIMPLAQKLGLSRTSFYWFYKDRGALLSALADLWEARTTAPLIQAVDSYAATKSEALLNLLGCFLAKDGFDAKLEFAMRSWALQDGSIMARTHQADQIRLQALRSLLENWGHDSQDADVRARTIYLVQIGYISMQQVETLAERIQRIPNYVAIYGGTPPTPPEMERFLAAHGF